jgi:hypothetical protein
MINIDLNRRNRRPLPGGRAWTPNRDRNRIGAIGLSAGGHRAPATATHFDKRTDDPIDGVDTVGCRPDLAISADAGDRVVSGRDRQRSGWSPGLGNRE